MESEVRITDINN